MSSEIEAESVISWYGGTSHKATQCVLYNRRWKWGTCHRDQRIIIIKKKPTGLKQHDKKSQRI